MKKIILVLLACVLCFSLCACGGGSSSEGDSAAKGNDEIIFEDEAIIAENDIAKVVLVNFYQEDVDGITHNCMTLKVTNKSEREFLFNVGRIYIGEEEIESVMIDGNKGPIPGKTNSFKYRIVHNDADYTPIDPIEMLYEIDGMIEFSIFSEDGEFIEDKVDEYFSIKDLEL